jgi:hypothetical protein
MTLPRFPVEVLVNELQRSFLDEISVFEVPYVVDVAEYQVVLGHYTVDE